MQQTNRPLSPHLSAYRWRITSALSILHRASGVFLSFGALLLVVWLLALASGPVQYARFVAVFSDMPGLLLPMAVSAAFFYHLMNGVRHLFWDAGVGFELSTARRSGWFVVIASASVFALFWFALLG